LLQAPNYSIGQFFDCPPGLFAAAVLQAREATLRMDTALLVPATVQLQQNLLDLDLPY
jgi:hypothetical protein